MGFPSPDFQTMDMLCKLVLCRDIRQFPPQNVVSVGMQRSAALWTAALLLRQFVQDLFYRKTRKIRFPLSTVLFPPAENRCLRRPFQRGFA